MPKKNKSTPATRETRTADAYNAVQEQRKKRQAAPVSAEPLPPQPKSNVDETAAVFEEMIGSEPAHSLEGYPLRPKRGVDEDARQRVKESGTVEDAAVAIESGLPDDVDAFEDDDDDADVEDFEDSEDEDFEDEDSEDEDSEIENPEQWHEFTEDELATPVKVKVDGEEIAVPLSEAIAGYQRQKATTKRFQEAAEMRREAEGLRSEVETLARQYSTAAETLNTVAANALNPEARAQLSQLAAQARADAAALEAQATQETLQRESAALREAMNWQDDNAAAAGKRELVQAAQAYGFEPQDLSGVMDHRALLILADAAKYRQMQAGANDAREVARTKRRQSPTLQPGTRTRRDSRKSAQRKALKASRAKLQETGRIDDAAAVLVSLLDDE